MDTRLTTLDLQTRGNTDILDITAQVIRVVKEHSLRSGVVTVFVRGSTGAVTTIEYESGVVQDLKDAIERLAPRTIPYAHDARWGDGNGFSHVRAALMGPSLQIPVQNGELMLGTWQQIVFCDFDNRPRRRKIMIQLMGVMKSNT